MVYESVDSEVFFRSVEERLKVQSPGSAKHLMLKVINSKTKDGRLNLIFKCPKMFHRVMRISEMVSMFRYFLGDCGHGISLIERL